MRNSTRSTFDVDLDAIPLLLGPRVVPPAEVKPLTPHEKYDLLAGQEIPGWATTYDDILTWHDAVFEGEMNRRRGKKQKVDIVIDITPPDLQTAEKLRGLWRRRISAADPTPWTPETARETMALMLKENPTCKEMMRGCLHYFGVAHLKQIHDRSLEAFMAELKKRYEIWQEGERSVRVAAIHPALSAPYGNRESVSAVTYVISSGGVIA